MQEIRQGELAALCEAATLLREQATDISEALETIGGYLGKIQDLCIEVRIFSFAICFKILE